MHDHRRHLLHSCIYKEAYTEKDERNTEPLTHVEYHVILKSDLYLLDELDEETASETSDEECSDEESPMESMLAVSSCPLII